MRNLGKGDIKILALSSLGGTLEFYDFIIFVFFAEYISSNFFPANLSDFWKMFNTYGIFAAGYLARPIGGIVMAHFGDKFGRKNMFMLSILLMVIPTFCLAFVPNFQSIGFACIICLVLIRIFQGIAIGGELPGAWVFTFEHAQKHLKHTYLGILTAAVVGGILLGSLVFLIMNFLFSQNELFEWAWRVPFFLGGIFGIISVYLRKFLSETPIFEEMKKRGELEKFPLKEVIKRAKLGVLTSMLITWVLTGCIVVLILLLPSYIAQLLHISKVEQTYLQMLAIVVIASSCVVVGILSDKIGIFKTSLIFSICFLGVCLVFFNALYSLNPIFYVVCILYLLACFCAGIMNLCPSIMSEVFDASIKFSGLSFAYNIAYAISGGFTPQLAYFLHDIAIKNMDNILSLALGAYMLLIALISIFSAFLYLKCKIKTAR
ncbi:MULTISPECIES: MFS transporter [unclassified Campylobacter]|uniref:MFS transporter n=1 Tax=unclassified Campylobacter TaxID=2593542 RepID=UPI001237A783|nr:MULTISPECIES: MFS transporter [unclassified Campylobacter]KAA6227222.1 MHS family MFS transporter [Campylobacter sp. LR286c]KAA6227904.1 MHS family MFS transporter [Campylobacter sp. LR185c]KAA6228313.1 MHS family MFS transporter [Campylobacter sp. LR196d]KAA6229314.1 MHS family MFS transporter [Campylobacter sp. LR291e]KAA8604408.1 MFS transporter [Campylobacter sp. LR185c]